MPAPSTSQADDAGLADTKEKEKAERQPVGPHHVLKWFGEVATHVKTQVDKVGLANTLAPCGLVVRFFETAVVAVRRGFFLRIAVDFVFVFPSA